MSFTPISSDPIADTTGLQNVAASKSSSGVFDSMLSGLSAAAYYSGDTVNAFAETYGSDTMASIASLTTNATYSSLGAAAELTASTAGSSSSGSTYLTGGYSSSSSLSSSGSSSSYLSSDSDLSTLAESSGADMSEMIALQLYMTEITTMFGAETNIIKAKSDAEKSAIANLK